MKESGKTFKPYAGDFSPSRGAGVLRRTAVGKGTPQEQAMLQLIEKGSEFSPGVGSISSPSRGLGQQLIKAQKGKQQYQVGYKKATQKVQAGIQPRLQQLTKREREVAKLMATKQRAAKIKGALLGTGITGTGAYLFHRWLTDKLLGGK